MRPEWLPGKAPGTGKATGAAAQPAPDAVASTPPGATTDRSFSLADAAARATPAVVNIISEDAALAGPGGANAESSGLPDGSDMGSLGSGVIVDSSGLILTNSHVVDSAQRHEVLLADGRRMSARLLGTDPETDLALLQADQTDLPAIRLRQTDDARVGDTVLAIGNPFGVGQTVTMGIISALGRDTLGINTFENFIQTDAAINPGNSGGALIDTRGDLLGINTAIYSRTGGSLGIGFAIPVTTAREVINQLRDHGSVVRGFIGVEPQDITPELASAFDLPLKSGAVVSGIVEAGPADAAGVQIGDIVLSVQGQAVPRTATLLDLVSWLTPGSTVVFGLLRQGKPLELPITIGERPPAGR